MRIKRLVIRNFGCFRGEQVLDLDAKAYAVVARFAQDSDRSNFGGKSTLLEAIDFALWGRHRHRTEDGFISNGEDKCSVKLVLDDGIDTTIVRSRTRGKNTRLGLEDRKGGAESVSTQDHAQAAVHLCLGIGADDFLHRAYFQQRQMARFILARPEDRMSVVSAWLRLDKLEAAEDHVRAKLADLNTKRALNAMQLTRAEENIKQALGTFVDTEAMEQAQIKLEEEREDIRGKILLFEEKLEKARANQLTHTQAAEYSQLVEEGKQAKARFQEVNLPTLEVAQETARSDEQRAAVARAAARETVTQRRLLARGQFGGECPVAGIACPATAEINARSLQNASRLKEAEATAQEAEARWGVTSAREKASTAAVQDAARLEERLEGLRQRARKLKPAYEAASKLPRGDDADRARQGISALQERLQAIAGELARLTQAQALLEDARLRRHDFAEKVREQDSWIGVHRAAMAILGRNGAQRRVAEGALAEIGADANALLASCGADLTASLSWAREGQGLAKHCHECGAPFPTSAKAKTCAGCGAERGPHLVQRLEVALSDRSGAAEDLVGIAVQLAASAWLRARRGGDWAVLMMDEPTSQMDRSHRRQFASHLGRMLRRSHVEQAFVISHSPDVFESLPGRIQITRDGAWSRAEVVA